MSIKSGRPRFSFTKRIREIKVNVFGDESCNNELEDDEEYDPNFAQLFEQIKQNGPLRGRNSRTGNMFNLADIEVSFNTSESDESTENNASKLNENPFSPNRTQILMNVDDDYLGEGGAGSNSEALSGEELANTEMEIKKPKKRKRGQSVIEGLPVSQTLAETMENLETGNVAGRKSKRTKLKPCAHWRLQRPKYVRDSTGLAWIISGVEEGSKEETATFKIPKKNTRKKPKKEAKSEFNDEYSIHVTNEEMACNESRKERLFESKLLVDMSRLEWKTSCSSGDGVKMALIQRDVNKEEAWGLLKVAGLAKKLPQETGDYTTYFTILKGLVCVVIGSNLSTILDHCSIFEIPPNTIYSIENIQRGESLLQFMVKKESHASVQNHI